MKKELKRLVVLTGVIGFLLVGCSEEEQPKEQTVNTEEINFSELYNLSDTTVLVEISGDKLTVGDVKEKAFKQALASTVNDFIEREVLLDEFKVSNKEVEEEMKKQKDTLGSHANNKSFDKDEIAYNIAYQKARTKLSDFTEDDLKEFYTKYYENSGKKFEEMKEELKERASFILGNQKMYELQRELKEKADISYYKEELKTLLDEKGHTAPKVKEKDRE